MNASRPLLVRSLVVAVIGASASVLACSGDAPPKPRAAIATNLSPGTNGTACTIAPMVWLDVGNIGATSMPVDGPVNPVDDGDQSTSVDCSVTGSGDTFNVNAQVNVHGTGGGSFAIDGTFTASGTQMNINANFGADVGGLKESDCTVQFIRPDMSGNDVMGVAPGRVWGYIICPKAADNSMQPPRSCSIQGEFRFENCSQ